MRHHEPFLAYEHTATSLCCGHDTIRYINEVNAAMKVEIWSDFISPHCYIGKRNFELALEKFPQKQYVKVQYKSFQLVENCKSQAQTLTQLLMDMYDLQFDEWQQFTKSVCKQAARIGLPMCLEDMKSTCTKDAHRLVKYAEKRGKDLEVVDLLFRHYFSAQENISDKKILLAIAKKCGLDEAEVKEVLSFDKYSRAVEYDNEEAEEIGVKDIPFFVFNEVYALVGNQPEEVFLQALEQTWQENEAYFRKQGKQEAMTIYCEGDECDLK